MSDELAKCPYCNGVVSARRLKAHTTQRCPKAPVVIQAKIEARVAASKIEQKKTTVLVRSRLERMYSDLCDQTKHPDDRELAKAFKTFYETCVVGGLRIPSRKSATIDGEESTSVRTVSGGLPSLGKRAR
ncbi:hypothetical protein [Ferriphaselus sp. R-1]|uniref:hypothetical protein n=1 Tax=Ferriphaselus sp. R-1 TaxID=1485544 RepID=UPI0012685582|nr:hypothetical protein [Ferriphaselus sp. R-1]